MSYIEKKYNTKIKEIFEQLSYLDSDLLTQLKKKSVKNINEIAKLCADFNHNINLILKKYYPEIKGMDDKLEIKSILKFYYDLIHYLTDLVRHIENFQKIDQEYYDKLVEFMHDKNDLISGKYRMICAQELTVFYDQVSRQNLEEVLLEKIERKSRNYFTFRLPRRRNQEDCYSRRSKCSYYFSRRYVKQRRPRFCEINHNVRDKRKPRF